MRTGDDKDGGTEAKVYIVLISTQAATEKIHLELVQKPGFEPVTAETSSVEGTDVGEVRKIEVGEWKHFYANWNIFEASILCKAQFLPFRISAQKLENLTCP